MDATAILEVMLVLVVMVIWAAIWFTIGIGKIEDEAIKRNLGNYAYNPETKQVEWKWREET